MPSDYLGESQFHENLQARHGSKKSKKEGLSTTLGTTAQLAATMAVEDINVISTRRALHSRLETNSRLLLKYFEVGMFQILILETVLEYFSTWFHH